MSGSTSNREVESILALFKAEGLDISNFDECIKSLSETCLPTRLTKTYKEKIYPHASHALTVTN